MEKQGGLEFTKKKIVIGKGLEFILKSTYGSDYKLPKKKKWFIIESLCAICVFSYCIFGHLINLFLGILFNKFISAIRVSIWVVFFPILLIMPSSKVVVAYLTFSLFFFIFCLFAFVVFYLLRTDLFKEEWEFKWTTEK